jgi:hypothetical protein
MRSIFLKRAVVAALFSTVLLSSTIVTGLGTVVQEAYAAKGGKGDKGDDSPSSDRGKDGEKGKSKNNTNTTTSEKQDKSKGHDTTTEDSKSNNGHKSAGTEEQDSILKKAQKLKQHQLGNETDVSWPYSTNSTYFIEANGTAKAIGANGSSSDAELSVEMSIWKTKKNMVSMDIIEGSIIVDGQTMEFYSGQAHYIPNRDKMLLTGFVIVGGNTGSELEGSDEGTGDNQTGTTTNQTSTGTNQTSVNTNQTSVDTGMNQTSTQIPQGEGVLSEDSEEEGPALRHIKLWIKVSDGSLATEESSEHEATIQILSPQSKIASKWFLGMNGEMYVSSS